MSLRFEDSGLVARTFIFIDKVIANVCISRSDLELYDALFCKFLKFNIMHGASLIVCKIYVFSTLGR